MKKLFTILLLIIFPLSTVNAVFKVPQDIILQDAFNFLKNKGAIEQEYKEYQFTTQINLQDFLKMLTKATDTEIDAQSLNPCTDLESNSPFIPYFAKAIELKAINISNGKCYPNKNVSKLNAIRIIFQIAGIPTPKTFNLKVAPKDIKKNSYYSSLFSRALEINLIQTDKNNYVFPFRSLKKQDAIELVFKTVVYLNPEMMIAENSSPSFQVEINGSNEEQTKELMNSLNLLNNTDVENVDILVETLNKLSSTYYYQEKDKINKKNIVYLTIESLTEKLSDPYTEFQKPTSKTLQIVLGDDFEGIGVEIGKNENKEFYVANILKNSPAEKAGMKVKDILRKVDGEDVSGLSDDELVTKIRGKQGTKVKITIYRPDTKEEKIIEITREQIQLVQVSSKMLENNIGYIEVTRFSINTAQDFQKAIDELTKQGAKKFIIDVRNNIGGYLDVTLEILGNFVEKGKVLTYVKTLKEEITEVSNGDAKYKNYPLVVLINEGSASASEIFAAVIQDYKLGKLVGTQSYGKGTVQEMNIFNNSAILKLTIAEWLTPNKKAIQGIGIEPNFKIENTNPNEDAQLKKAIEVIGNS